MNANEQKKRIIRARLIRLPIFLGILFSFAWMFRWDIGATTGGGDQIYVHYAKLDRWTGATYGCVFLGREIRVSDEGPICVQEQPR